MFRRVDAAEHLEDGDGVGGGDEGTEEKAFKERGLEAEEAGSVEGDSADGEGGEDGGDDGEQSDGQSLAVECAEVEEEGSGEEEEGEHSVEDEALEVDLVEERQGEAVGGRPDRGEQDEGDGSRRRQEHGADGVGELQEASAEPSEDGCDGDDDADQQKHMFRISGGGAVEGKIEISGVGLGREVAAKLRCAAMIVAGEVERILFSKN